jgi:protein gp37
MWYDDWSKSVWTEFISLVPYVTLWRDFSEVDAHPQSARPHCSHSVSHNHCKQTVVFVVHRFVMFENTAQHEYQILHKTRNSSVYCKKDWKKSVRTQFISLVPYII